MSLNVCTLQGKLKEAPELRETPTGYIACARLSVTRDYKNKDGIRETDWIPIVTFNGVAKFFAQHFEAGQSAVVTGKLQVRKYPTKSGEARYVTEVVADSIYFADKKPKTCEEDCDAADIPDEEVQE